MRSKFVYITVGIATFIIFILIALFIYDHHEEGIVESFETIGGLTNHHIYLRPGESVKTRYVLYSGNEEGTVRFEVYRVMRVGDTHGVQTPISINVTVKPSTIKVYPHRRYVFNVIVRTNTNSKGSYIFLIRARINGKFIDDWLRVLVAQNPSPGFASLYLPRIKHLKNVTLKAGDSTEIHYTLYTEESPPGIVKLKVYRVENIYKTKEISMPEGLNVNVIPSKLLVEPHHTYTFKIKIKTNRSLPAGKYIFCIQLSGTIGVARSWLTINVQ